MKRFISLYFALLTVATLSAQEAAQTQSNEVAPQTIVQMQHFGYLSYNEMLQSMPEYGIAMAKLQNLKKTYDNELERAEADFSRKFQEFVEGQRTFPENIMLKRQKELQQLMEESLAFKEQAKQLLTQAEEELMRPLHQKLKEVMREVGLQHNYAYILNTDNNAYPFVNTTGEAEDCSELVKEKLRR